MNDRHTIEQTPSRYALACDQLTRTPEGWCIHARERVILHETGTCSVPGAA